MTPNSTDITLSICVPTFNRANALKTTLAAICRQISADGLAGKIEVLVSDNCSTDDTQNVGAEFSAFPLFRYVRNSTNVGFDRNCDNAVHLATGHFVWLMSDDDHLEEGAIAKICALLDVHQDVVFAFVNYSVVQPDGVEPSSCAITDVVRMSGGELIVNTRFAFSFVTSCVFSREQWISNSGAAYFGTGWIHLLKARDVLTRGDALIVGERLIKMHGMDLVTSRKEKLDEYRELEFYISSYINFLEFAFSLRKHGYTDSVIKDAVNISWTNSLRQIIYYKATRQKYLPRELWFIARRMAAYFGTRPGFWVMHVPLLYAPNSLVALLYFGLRPLYRKLKYAN